MPKAVCVATCSAARSPYCWPRVKEMMATRREAHPAASCRCPSSEANSHSCSRPWKAAHQKLSQKNWEQQTASCVVTSSGLLQASDARPQVGGMGIQRAAYQN